MITGIFRIRTNRPESLKEEIEPMIITVIFKDLESKKALEIDVNPGNPGNWEAEKNFCLMITGIFRIRTNRPESLKEENWAHDYCDF